MAKEEKKPEKEGAEETTPAPAKRRKMPTFGLVGGVMIVGAVSTLIAALLLVTVPQAFETTTL